MSPKVFLVLLVLSLSLESFSNSQVNTTALSSTPQVQDCTTKEGVKYRCKEGQPIPLGSNDTRNHQYSPHDKPSSSPVRQALIADKPAGGSSHKCADRSCKNG